MNDQQSKMDACDHDHVLYHKDKDPRINYICAKCGNKAIILKRENYNKFKERSREG